VRVADVKKNVQCNTSCFCTKKPATGTSRGWLLCSSRNAWPGTAMRWAISSERKKRKSHGA
jgi:hypothetical protein